MNQRHNYVSTWMQADRTRRLVQTGSMRWDDAGCMLNQHLTVGRSRSGGCPLDAIELRPTFGLTDLALTCGR